VASAARQVQVEEQPAVVVGPGVRGTGPADPQLAGPRGPDPLLQGQVAHRIAAEGVTELELDPHGDVALDGFEAAQEHDALGIGWIGQRVAALHFGVRADPPVAPDQGAGFVVPAPDARVDRADGVAAPPAGQGGEDAAVGPAGRAQPGDVAAWAAERASFAVGEERVLAQDVRREIVPVAHDFARRHSARPAAAAAPPQPASRPWWRLAHSWRLRGVDLPSNAPWAP
jgi:hypothetical protein